MSTKSTYQIVLKVCLILITAGWVSLWLLKPTELWTKSWKEAEDSARATVFGYYGLNFAVYSLPVIAIAVIGYIYLHLTAKGERNRHTRKSISSLSNPVIVHSSLGIISGTELLAASLFIIFLVWTIYAHLYKDFTKIIRVKSLKLNVWQFKFMKIGTRLGLLAEACLALLLLPVLRGMSIFRLIGVQFEASVRYHACLGTAMLFFSMLHGFSAFFIWGVNHRLLDEMWLWQNTGRVYLAGELALVVGLVIWITSLPQIRRKWFEVFYYTHHLYIIFLVFFLFHVGDRHFYMVFSGVLLYILDKLLRIIQSRPATHLVSARIFPCKAVELNLPKNIGLKYTPTSVIYLKVPSISKLEWHPFSVTSSSSIDDDRISVIVRGEGRWTNSLYNKILTALDSNAYEVNCLPVHIEGPYGPTSSDFLRYENLLMVAGGIGITPFLSILQEMASTRYNKRTRLSARVQLIYVVKKSQDISLLDPIKLLLLNQTADQPNLVVKIFVTQEKKTTRTMEELLNDQVSHIQTVNFGTKCMNHTNTNTGPEGLPWLAATAGFSSVAFLMALGILNHAFLHTGNKESEKKNPSWATDLLLICSAAIATIFGISVVAITKWRMMKNATPRPAPAKQNKGIEVSSLERNGNDIKQHQIQYGNRPNFEDILSEFPTEAGTSDVGVFVCGPESMKESVAEFCRKHSQCGFSVGANDRKRFFSFHSLNFAL